MIVYSKKKFIYLHPLLDLRVADHVERGPGEGGGGGLRARQEQVEHHVLEVLDPEVPVEAGGGVRGVQDLDQHRVREVPGGVHIQRGLVLGDALRHHVDNVMVNSVSRKIFFI